MNVPPFVIICNACQAGGASAVQIEHAVTQDFPGPAVPGFLDDGILWALVATIPAAARYGGAST